MRVLHIWDPAFIASTLCRELKKAFNVDYRIIFRHSESPWGSFDDITYWDYPKYILGMRLLLETRKYDLIHLHSKDEFLPYVKKLFPNKPVLLHYHGTDIRDHWYEKRNRWSHADYIIVSTIDLLDGAPSNARWLPNPINRQDFPNGPIGHGCVHFRYGCDDIAKELAKKNGLELTILPRNIPRSEIVNTLRKFSHIIPLKISHGKLLSDSKNQYSVLELEALSLGLSTVKIDGIYSGFPIEHDSSKVGKQIFRIYKQLLEKPRVN